MIIRHPLHPGHLCKDPDSISWPFLKQLVLVSFAIESWGVGWGGMEGGGGPNDYSSTHGWGGVSQDPQK